METERVIFHIDCNGFYAAVECLDDPSLLEIPMAVAGDPEARSGIILAKNEKARRYGVKTAETIYQAKRKCPFLRLVPPHFSRYAEISRRVKQLFSEYTDQVESFGLDEAWLDVTGSLRYFRTTPRSLADRIRERVKQEIGITVSVGVSFNKVFAKLGSDLKKPDATSVITKENFRQIVWRLPVSDMLFVGKTTAEVLRRNYILTIGDLARTSEEALEKLLGKQGPVFWRYANGLDEAPVLRIGEEEPTKSISNGMTFRRNLLGYDELKSGVVALTDEVASRLREEKLRCLGVQIMIRDPDMQTITRQTILAKPTHLQKEIVDAAMRLIRQHWPEAAPVRAIAVTAARLITERGACEQTSLLGTEAQQRSRFEHAEEAMQKLRRKYGRSCIAMGYVEDESMGIRQFEHREEQPQP